MVPVSDLFQTHLTVSDFQRSKTFFGQILVWTLLGCFRNEG